jgi:hypothetical protein
MAKKGAGAATGGPAAGAGDVDDWAAQLKAMMEDPSHLEKYGDIGNQMASAMEEMMKLSPAEMAKQMEEAMKLMTDEDVVENVVNQREEVLKSLETSGMVPPEELAKFKADPNYYEQKMRESFQQMGKIFSDKDTLTKTAEMMKGLTELMTDPSALNKLSEAIQEHVHDDGKIEEMRQMMLKGEMEGMAALKQMFNLPEMADILSDPKKFRATVQDGMNLMNNELKDSKKDEL